MLDKTNGNNIGEVLNLCNQIIVFILVHDFFIFSKAYKISEKTKIGPYFYGFDEPIIYKDN